MWGYTCKSIFYHDPEVYIGRQLCIFSWFGEYTYTSPIVDSLKRLRAYLCGLVYMVPFKAILLFLLGSTSLLNSWRLRVNLSGPVRRMTTAGEYSRHKVNNITVYFQFNNWNLSKRYVKKCEFGYVLSYRSFSSKHRSERTVVTDSGKRSKLDFPYLALPVKAGEVSQAEILMAGKLWDMFKNRINKASPKVQQAFSQQQFREMFINLNYVMDVQISQGYCKDNLFILLSGPCYLVYCYTLLKQNVSHGSDLVPISTVTLPSIFSLSKKIQNGSYKPSPVRRVYIQKCNGRTRPLCIASGLDKIVQKSILILIERTFEPTFNDVSHGFRQQRSCHTALHSIYYYWLRTKWFIEADFINYFDRTSHNKLLFAINKKIKCYKLSLLINQLLTVGYINFANLANSELKNLEGSPQGSLLSPLFCNILLDELDIFILALCNSIIVQRVRVASDDWKASRRFLNTSWEKVWSDIKTLTSRRVSGKKISNALLKIKSQDAALRGMRIAKEETNWKRLTYVRYADDFLLGYIGSKSDAVELLIRISHFADSYLGMKLQCAVELVIPLCS